MSKFGTKRTDIKWKRINLNENSLTGKKIAVIGGTNGVGRGIALEFISKGAEVIVVGRTFRDQDIEKLTFIQADLSEMDKVLLFAKELPAENLDALIMTHGIFPAKERKTNSKGIEIDMATSALSRFVILREIADRIGKNRINQTVKPRVFVWGFPGGKRKIDLDDFNSEINYNWSLAHSNGVVVNETLVLDSATRFPLVNFYGMNPGIINSNIMSGILGDNSILLKIQKTIVGLFFQSPEQYAKKITPLLVSKDIEKYSGIMFGRNGDPILSNSILLDQSYVNQVIEEAEKLIDSNK